MTHRPAGASSAAEAAVSSARWLALVTTAGLLVFASAAEWIPIDTHWTAVAFPAGLFGLLAPVIGFRLYEWLRSRGGDPETELEAGKRFSNATLLALAVTEAAGALGVVAYLFSGRLVALTGLLTHVLLAGAIWPSMDRFELFSGS